MAKADGEFKPKKVCSWYLLCRNDVLHIDFGGVLLMVIVVALSRLRLQPQSNIMLLFSFPHYFI